MMNKPSKYYRTIIVGAGASGLYCACNINCETLILEKTSRPGTKLLMAGSGQCNVTHGGSVKDFLSCYGPDGRRIRGILQRHNNIELCRFLQSLGVPLTEREDGKIFPASMDSGDVLDALLKELEGKGTEIKYETEVVGIGIDMEISKGPRFIVKTTEGSYSCHNLVIATGGCSYPATGSDGSMFRVLARDLGISIVEPVPALTPVYVEKYPYGDLSGISFKDAGLKILDQKGKKAHEATGDLLLTFKNFSGPVIINNSRYIKTGMTIELSFLGSVKIEELLEKFRKEFPGNNKSPQNYLAEELGLPKRFAALVAEEIAVTQVNPGAADNTVRKVSQLTGSQLKTLAESLTSRRFTVSGLAGFKEAMVTKGGVDLEEINLSTMESKKYPGLCFIGEVVDIDGDTGGYNLQFAYSSAKAVAEEL